MATNIKDRYNPAYDQWPDLRQTRIIIKPVRVGVDRRTGKILVGWPHVLQSMRTIFVTRFHERILRGWVGSFVPHILGDSANLPVITRFYWAIMSALDLWEPNYNVERVVVDNRPTDNLSLTSVEELRQGILTVRHEGVYRPRGHLGDTTAEDRRIATIGGSGGFQR